MKENPTIENILRNSSKLEACKKIQEIASSYGFDWDRKEASWMKVEEEIDELKIEVKRNDYDKQKDEFGDILFALVNYARFLNIDPVESLDIANRKFSKRFEKTKALIQEAGLKMKELSQNELTLYWKKAKKEV